MAFVLLPTADQLDVGQHDKLRGLVNGRWKRFVHLGILLFLVTGFYNYFRQMPNHKGDALYHALIGKGLALRGWRMSGYWSDIGTRERYEQAERDAAEGRLTIS